VTATVAPWSPALLPAPFLLPNENCQVSYNNIEMKMEKLKILLKSNCLPNSDSST
jgi:hypothetical protein